MEQDAAAAKAAGLHKQGYTQNRELSWLKFNKRVLEEGMDETVPLLERLKFISIFTSNLDEFFMIRVGSLHDMLGMKEPAVDNRSGMTAEQQLEAIYKEVRPLYKEKEKAYEEVEGQLRLHGIFRLKIKELTPSEKKYVKQYFENAVLPILSPQIVDSHHPFPHLANEVMHVGAMIKIEDKTLFSVIPIPTALPDLIFLPGNEVRYVGMEDIVLEYYETVFSMYKIGEKTVFRVTRNGDINADDEAFDIENDFRKKMKKLLQQRKRLEAVRLELGRAVGGSLIPFLASKLDLQKNQVFITSAPLSLPYAFSLESKVAMAAKRTLSYRPFEPQPCPRVRMDESLISQYQKKDLLLSYPFEKMSPYLRLIKEAAYDPHVISIKITIYRLARQAKLVEYLCAAAENGKDVTAMIELRARFDEQNNIDWSQRLEEAGCQVIYGLEGYKVHSKITLITIREKGDVKYITQVGTGNYNEKTAKSYTDLCLITTNQEIGLDATEFFKNMSIGNLMGSYKHLIVAPVGLKSTLLNLIDEEIAKRENGRIMIKINSITDIDIIERLKLASCQQVKIRMIVRGICCLVPGVKDKTENIEIHSIVGRYLEHSRIYCFGSGSEEKLFISSADFMTRNTERRVEVACPIYDEQVKAQLHHILDTCFADNVKARKLGNDGQLHKIKDDNPMVDSQNTFMTEALNAATQISPKRKKGNFLSRLFKRKQSFH
ncbi:MAG: polyphosphate kinase 1 [Spirochaetia bacterium]|nr:polyphosphate kinase 1 [Spirochaetia bacterium]